MFDAVAIGTDIEKISRFEGKTPEKNSDFLNRIFTLKEIEYCFNTKNYASHLCARFCGKEAVVKALSDFGIKDVYYSDIEILNREDGLPYVVVEKYKDLKFKITLSHCKEYATATVLVMSK